MADLELHWDAIMCSLCILAACIFSINKSCRKMERQTNIHLSRDFCSASGCKRASECGKSEVWRPVQPRGDDRERQRKQERGAFPYSKNSDDTMTACSRSKCPFILIQFWQLTQNKLYFLCDFPWLNILTKSCDVTICNYLLSSGSSS